MFLKSSLTMKSIGVALFFLIIALMTRFYSSSQPIEIIFSPEQILQSELQLKFSKKAKPFVFQGDIIVNNMNIPAEITALGDWNSYLNGDRWMLLVRPKKYVDRVPSSFFVVPPNYKDIAAVGKNQPGMEEAGYAVVNKKYKGQIYKPIASDFTGKISAEEKNINEVRLHELGVDFLEIDMKKKNLFKLVSARNEIIEDYGVIDKLHNAEVSAGLRINKNNSIPVKLNFKGDWSGHINTDKWSMKIKLKGDQKYRGMGQFSLQSDTVRNGYNEILFMQILKKAGVVVPNYFYVYLKVNGRPIGLMELEERWSSILQSSHRRKGLMFSLDESELFQQWRANLKAGQSPVKDASLLFDTQFNPSAFHSFKLLSSSSKKELVQLPQFNRGLGLLRGLTEGFLKPDDIFDMKLMARYSAALVWWHGIHALVPHNQHFYYNPSLDLFEPIGFDANINSETWGRPTFDSLYWHVLRDSGSCEKNPEVCVLTKSYTRVTESKDFWIYYRQALNFYKKLYFDEHFNEELVRQENIFREIKLSAGESLPEKTDFNLLGEKLTKLLINFKEPSGTALKKLAPIAREIANWDVLALPAQAFLIKNKNSYYLEMKNLTPQVLVIDQIISVNSARETIILEKQRIELLPTIAALKKLKIELPLSVFGKKTQLKVHVKYKNHSWWVEAKNYAEVIEKNEYVSTPVNQLKNEIAGVSIDFKNRVVRLAPKHYTFQKSMSLPQDWTLAISAGARLQFCQTCILYTRGKVLIEGSVSNPVQMGPSDEFWPGIVLDNRDQESLISNLKIRGMVKKTDAGPGSNGGFVIYGGKINVNGLEILNSKVEDALNLVLVDGNFKNVYIQDSASDAIDLDFSNVNMDKVVIENAGNDGLDFGTSTGVISNITVSQAGDKGISAGEASVVSGRFLNLSNVETGVGVKDLSRFSAEHLSINNCKTGISGYQKKTEFGGGFSQVSDLKITNCLKNIKLDAKSSVVVD